MSSEGKPSNPHPVRSEQLASTLSEHAEDKNVGKAREELETHLANKAEAAMKASAEAEKVGQEVAAATTKFLDGVDVITETLILILGKFSTISYRTTIGMIFGGMILAACILVVFQTWQTTKAQQANADKVSELTVKFDDAVAKLNSIQESANSAEEKLEAVKTAAETKPSIEIVADENKPGSAKVVIRPPTSMGHGSSSKSYKSSGLVKIAKPQMFENPPPPPPEPSPPPPPENLLEIPIQLPKAAK